MRTSFAALSPIVAVLLAGCISAEPTVVGGVSADGGHDGSHPNADAGHDTGADVTTKDARSDSKSSTDTGVDAGHDSGHETEDSGENDTGVGSGHDAGIDATGICNTEVAYGDAAPGSVDPGFGVVNVSSTIGSPTHMLQDSQGRIYLIGNRNDCVSRTSNTDFAITRLTSMGNPDLSYGRVDGGADPGELDGGFSSGSGGTVCVDFVGGADLFYSAALDSQENLLVAGFATEPPLRTGDGGDSTARYYFTARPAVARLTPAGLPDLTFNMTGKIRIAAGPPEAQEANAIVVDSEDNIYLAGTTQAFPVPADPDATTATYAPLAGWVAKLRGTAIGGGAIGSVDIAWGTSGFVTDDGLSEFTGATILGSSLIVVGTTLGTKEDGGAAGTLYHRQFVTRRYNTTDPGGVDTSFNSQPGGSVDAGSNGEALASPGANDYAQSVLIDSAQRIVVSGFASVGTTVLGGAGLNAGEFGPGYAAVVRYLANGTLDTTFGTGGMYVSPDLKGFPAYEATMAAEQCDGKILVGALVCPQASITTNIFSKSSQTLAVLRLTSVGAADTTYAGGADAGPGISDLPLTYFANVNSLLVDPKQRVLVLAGTSGTGSMGPVLTRFLP